MKKKQIFKVYIAGSMEGRTYEALKYEHYYVRNQLISLGLEVFDPLLKENHKPGSLVGLNNCGLPRKQVYSQDLKAVENAHIILWVTGDRATEGSITEIAWAGCMNRFKIKPKKFIAIVSPLRYKKKINHFANMHPNTKIFKSVDDAIISIKRRFKL